MSGERSKERSGKESEPDPAGLFVPECNVMLCNPAYVTCTVL